jgi:hypothetical protein
MSTDVVTYRKCGLRECAFNILGGCIEKKPNCIQTKPHIGPVNMRKVQKEDRKKDCKPDLET